MSRPKKVKKEIEKKCPTCNKKFKTIRVEQKYCSSYCVQHRIWTDEEREKVGTKSKQKFIDNPELRQVMSNTAKKTWESGKLSTPEAKAAQGHFLGKHHNEETKEKISKGNKGKIVSKETKEKISKAHWAWNIKLRKKIAEEHSKKMIKLIEEGKIKLGVGYRTGWYISNKTRISENYHSSYELKRMEQLDGDKNVKTWTKNHGIRIEYCKNNIKHFYIPDFLITYINKNIIIEEVKGWIRNKKVFKLKKDAAINYCKEHNYKYEINFMRKDKD